MKQNQSFIPLNELKTLAEGTHVWVQDFTWAKTVLCGRITHKSNPQPGRLYVACLNEKITPVLYSEQEYGTCWLAYYERPELWTDESKFRLACQFVFKYEKGLKAQIKATEDGALSFTCPLDFLNEDQDRLARAYGHLCGFSWEGNDTHVFAVFYEYETTDGISVIWRMDTPSRKTAEEMAAKYLTFRCKGTAPNDPTGERIIKLYKELDAILNNAPAEEDCSDEENEMYSDMANLKDSIFDAGYVEV